LTKSSIFSLAKSIVKIELFTSMPSAPLTRFAISDAHLSNSFFMILVFLPLLSQSAKQKERGSQNTTKPFGRRE
jgi:hypothetical protein